MVGKEMIFKIFVAILLGYKVMVELSKYVREIMTGRENDDGRRCDDEECDYKNAPI